MEAAGRQGRGEKPLLQPRMQWDDFLACGLREARGLIVHIQKIYLIVTRMLGQTQRWAINDYLGS